MQINFSHFSPLATNSAGQAGMRSYVETTGAGSEAFF